MTTPTDRSVTALVVTVLGGYGLLAYAAVAPGLNLVGALLGLVLALAVLGVQLGYVSRPGRRRSREGTALALLALACLLYVPVVAVGAGWIGFAGFLAGSLLILLPWRAGLAGLAVVVVSVGVLVAFAGAPPLAVITSAVGALVTGLVVSGLTRLWAITTVPVPAVTVEPPAPAPLPERLRSARVELDAAGVELAVLGEDVDLPEEAGTLFAALVDVAVRHAARHADATTCRVTIARRAAEARIVVSHDGATDDPDPADFEPLGDRFDAHDGSVLAERDGTEFTVEGRLPLRGGSAP